MMLPRLPSSNEEHLEQWAMELESELEEDRIGESLIRKLKDLVCSRKKRMRNMLQSSKRPSRYLLI